MDEVDFEHVIEKLKGDDWHWRGYKAVDYVWRYEELTRDQIDRLQEIVIDYGNPGDAYDFARIARGANIKALEEVVIRGKEECWLRSFAANIPGANVERIKKVLVML